jgi:hypothetical protein
MNRRRSGGTNKSANISTRPSPITEISRLIREVFILFRGNRREEALTGMSGFAVAGSFNSGYGLRHDFFRVGIIFSVSKRGQTPKTNRLANSSA